jgi:hypothetical protein
MTNPTKSAADLLAEVGRALFDSDDWQARLARTLGVERDSIRQWQRPRSTFSLRHPVFETLLELAERRADETARARDALKAALSERKAP